MKYIGSEKTYQELANFEYENPMALDSLWLGLNALGKEITFAEIVKENFSLKKEIFFHVIRLLMTDGRLRLAKNGVFLTGTVDVQLQKFEAAFPASEESQKDIGGVSTWFFMDECPAGAVWVYQLEDGSEHLEWT